MRAPWRNVSLHYVALGDSTTVGVGDPMNGSSTTDLSGAGARSGEGWRGWASLLAESLASSHRVTFSNFATSGATVNLVATEQLPETGSGPIDLASLIVGVNDTLRSTFDPGRIREHLHVCAEQLTARGALLLTVRFHDHGQVFGLPKWMRRPLWQRIEQVNLAYDDLYARYGGVRLDMADYPEVYRRDFWSIDRLHPGSVGTATWPGSSPTSSPSAACGSTYRRRWTALTSRRASGRTRSGWCGRVCRGSGAGPAIWSRSSPGWGWVH